MLNPKLAQKIFMLESNSIEGETGLNPGDIKALDFTLETGCKNLEHILTLHNILGKHLKQPWVGKLRTINVEIGVGRIGKKAIECPEEWKIPALMDAYITQLPYLDSFNAHNKFEIIHPFNDLNGRVGRLIWLSKAIQEGYIFQIPFLHEYYYQSIGHYRLNKRYY